MNKNYSVKIITKSQGCCGTRYYYSVLARNKNEAVKKAIIKHTQTGYDIRNITQTITLLTP